MDIVSEIVDLIKNRESFVQYEYIEKYLDKKKINLPTAMGIFVQVATKLNFRCREMSSFKLKMDIYGIEESTEMGKCIFR